MNTVRQPAADVKAATCEDCGHTGSDVSWRYHWHPGGGYHEAVCNDRAACERRQDARALFRAFNVLPQEAER